MNFDLEKKLADEFPFMRRNEEAPSLYDAFGCECGDGWFELIRNMCKEITVTLGGREIRIEQLKEKYGTLRIYFTTDPAVYKQIREIRDKYEDLSETVCEECGQPGTLRKVRNWYTVLCDSCLVARTGTTVPI